MERTSVARHTKGRVGRVWASGALIVVILSLLTQWRKRVALEEAGWAIWDLPLPSSQFFCEPEPLIMKTEVKSNNRENSPAVQWLELCASNAGLDRQSLVGELRPHMPYNNSNKARGPCEGDLGGLLLEWGVREAPPGRMWRWSCHRRLPGVGEHKLGVLWDWTPGGSEEWGEQRAGRPL